MKTWQGIIFGILIGITISAINNLIILPPRGEPITLSAPPTPAPISVYITGAVQSPGLYQIARDSRINDALLTAGGLSPQANADAINLANRVKDGERIHVPTRAPTSAGTAATLSATPAVRGTPALLAAETRQGLIDLNTATQAELELLPGIGETRAQQILAYRQEHGPFKKTEDMMLIPGIGPSTYDKLKHLITISN